MYEYKIKEIDRIVDGDTVDTIDLGSMSSTRPECMYGINTPETQTRDLEEKAKGLAAKERLNEIINKAVHMGHHLILNKGESLAATLV